MNILFITPSMPSRLHRIRSFELIKSLSSNNKVHAIGLSLNKDQFPDELKGIVASYQVVNKPYLKSLIDCIVCLFSSLPLEAAYCRSKEMNQLINKAIGEKQIDLIYAKRLRSAQYVINMIGAKIDIPIVLDTTDAMSLFYKRAFANAPLIKKILFAEEYLKYLLYEKKVAKRLKNWVACSPIDAEYLRGRLPGINVEVIPNIVDTEYFHGEVSGEDGKPERHSILFSGLMDKFVNIEAADFLVREIYPIIARKYPDMKIYLVGPNPVSRIRKYKSANIIVTGYVEDIREYMNKVQVVVCPVKTGTGVRNKILQAWAMGKPVVSTAAGLAGLEGSHESELLVANGAESFANCVSNLFDDKNLRIKLAVNGRKLIEDKYCRGAVNEKLNKFINIAGNP